MKLFPENRKFAVVLIAALFWLWPFQSRAADRTTVEPEKTASSPASQAIPPDQVPMRAAQASDFLHSLKKFETPDPEIEGIEKVLPKEDERIGRELAETNMMLQNGPRLFTLQASHEHWQESQLKIAGWLKLTTERITQLQDTLHRLDNLRTIWTQTLTSARESNVSGPVLQQIESTVSSIEAAQQELKPRLDAVVDLESRVAAEKVRCDSVISEIAEAQSNAMSGIMARGLPIWSPDLWASTRSEVVARTREIARNCLADISLYFRDPTKGMPLHVGLFVVLVVLIGSAGRRARRLAIESGGSPPAEIVFERPYSAALLIPMALGAAVWSPAPPAVRELFPVLGFAPMLRIVRPVFDPRVIRWFWVLGVLFALDILLQLFDVAASVERAVLLVEILGGSLVIWKLDVIWGLLRYRSKDTVPVRFRALHMVVVIYRVGLAVALLAVITGYSALARFLTSGILAGFFIAVWLVALIQVLDAIVALALDSRRLASMEIVRRFHQIFERRAHRVFVWMAVGTWVIRSLDAVGLFQPTSNLIRAAFGAKFRIGSVSISVENVLAFILTVVAAYLLSIFVRFVLREDIYPRIGVERGLSYAISSLVHYIILALGFVLAVTALGVNLTQITVLAGAFGVGIGFGLQSMVNNFASGLILLFERPVHVGDTIQVGDLYGEIRRIGMRASSVRTPQGADIIVPNAQLITERVTNWTLSDRLRRIDLPVGLNYGVEPAKAIQLLVDVAQRHPKVLKTPPPQGLLIGYGDSSMNFQLQAWTDQFDNWLRISSELASAVYDAVIEAGMQFPFPQREVRLLRDPGAGPVSEKKEDDSPADREVFVR